MSVGGPAANPAPGLVEALSDPTTYRHHVEHVEVIETHVSWVFLAGAYAYKVKKPVKLAFVDQSDLARRRELCFTELRLNTRLAPGIYLGVQGLAVRGGRWQLTDSHAEDAQEFAIEMTRFDEADTLAARLAAGSVVPHDIERVAQRIAWFHHDQPALAPKAPVDAFVRTVHQNLAELDEFTGSALDRRQLAGAQRFAASFVAGRRALLEERAFAGFVRDGHGDLRAEHVLLDKRGVEVFDCLEFDPRLRQTDVGADLAFLAMDLEALGRADLVATLVQSYRDTGGDPGPANLFAFFVAHRAWVRAKVAVMRRRQLGGKSPRAAELRSQALRLARLARAAAWRARGPLALVVCGPSASGKTFLASHLAQLSGLAHLSSDLVRKEQAGVAAMERAPAGAYDQEANARVYRELGSRAAGAAGVGVIVDATFRHRRDRDTFAAAYGADGPTPVFVQCHAALDTVLGRAHARWWSEEGSASDADPEQVARQQHEFEPLDEVDPECHLTVRTDRPVAHAAAEVEGFLDSRIAQQHWRPRNAP